MTKRRGLIPMVFVLGLLLAMRGWAAEDGQQDLDKATDLKLKAVTIEDLGEVARLCEEAMAKGLNPDDEAFAKKLLTGSLYQRARPQCELIVQARRLSRELQQRRAELLADVRKIIKYDDKFGQAYLMLAQLEGLEGGDRNEARKAIDRAVELLTEDNTALVNAILIRGQLQESEEARLADFDRAVELDPENPTVWQTRALYFLAKGDLKKAIADFNSLLAKDGDNMLARLAVAQALMNVDEFEEAMKNVNHVIEKQPNVIALTLRAQLWTREDRLDKALEDVEQALSLAPRDLGLLLMRARLYHADDRNALAKADVDQVLQSQPDYPPAIELRSSVAAALGEFQQAVNDVSALLKRDPENSLLKLQLAIYLNAAGESRRSIDVFGDVLQADPGNGVAYRGRADAYLNLGAHKKAVADYEIALKSAPEDSGILNNFAWVLATSPDETLRDGKRAIDLGTKACELTEFKQAHIISTLAAAYAETGDFASARKWSQKAVEISDESVQGQLLQELESYKQDKPWRERKAEENSKQKPTPKAESANEDNESTDAAGTPPTR